MAFKRNSRRSLAAKKRWYINASATLPFVGKTKFTAGTTSPTAIKQKKSKRDLTNFVKDVVKRQHEPKVWYEGGNLDTAAGITNNTWFTYNIFEDLPFQAVATADLDQREGHVIDVKNIKIQYKEVCTLGFNTPIDYSLTLISHPTKSSTGGIWASALGNSNLLQELSDGTYPTLPIQGKFEPSKGVMKHWQYFGVVHPKGGTYSADAYFARLVEHDIPFNKRLVYDEDDNSGSGFYLKGRQYYFVLQSHAHSIATGTAHAMKFDESYMKINFTDA